MFGLFPLLYIFLACLRCAYVDAQCTQDCILFETTSIGNPSASKWDYKTWAVNSSVSSISVYWDGDKIRGMHVHKILCLFYNEPSTLYANFPKGRKALAHWIYLILLTPGILGVNVTRFDGTGGATGQFTGYNSTFAFNEGEALESLTLTDSGYGYGSFRQINFTTTLGRYFTAGPSGYDNITQPPVAGAYLVGFEAWVNVDVFINAFAIYGSYDLISWRSSGYSGA